MSNITLKAKVTVKGELLEMCKLPPKKKKKTIWATVNNMCRISRHFTLTCSLATKTFLEEKSGVFVCQIRVFQVF